MQWFFSDPHAYHKNIVAGISEWTNKSGCRDFPDQASHVKWLWSTINEKVAPSDVLWCLGDWSFGGEARISQFREGIRCGDVKLILGNHDYHLRKAASDSRKYGFTEIRDYAELAPAKGIQLVLFHYPILSWVNMERGAYMLHGHTHGNDRVKAPGRYNVGLDVDKGCLGLVSLDDIARLPRSNEKRHDHNAGGNVFGT